MCCHVHVLSPISPMHPQNAHKHTPVHPVGWVSQLPSWCALKLLVQLRWFSLLTGDEFAVGCQHSGAADACDLECEGEQERECERVCSKFYSAAPSFFTPFTFTPSLNSSLSYKQSLTLSLTCARKKLASVPGNRGYVDTRESRRPVSSFFSRRADLI